MTLRELGFSRDRMYLFKGLSGRVRASLSLVCRGIFRVFGRVKGGGRLS